MSTTTTNETISNGNAANGTNNNNNNNNARSTLKAGAANFTQSCLAFLQRSLTIRKWIETVLGETIDEKETLFEAIRDGVLLCRVMMTVRADSIPKIHTGTKLNFKIRENLLFFLQALEDVGVSRYYIFQVTDLIDRKNDIKVLESLEVFGDLVGEIDKSKAIQQLPEDHAIPFSDAELTEAEKVLKKLNISQLKRQPCTKALQPSLNNNNNGLSNSTNNANKHRSLTTSASATNKFITPSSQPRPRPSLSPAQIIQKAKPFEKRWIRIQALVRGLLQRKQFHRRVRNAAYRHNIVKEILSTEEIYVKNLAHLSKNYFEPIQENAAKLNIKHEHLKQMFSNIEVIKNYNNKFLEDLKPIIENWSHFQKIGHIFSQFILLLKVYTQYVKEYTQSYEILNNNRKNNSKFESFIAEKEAIDGKSINDYLILPVQRIPRYTLLLADLVKNTWKDHKDYNDLTESLKTMQEVATYVNEKKREAENIQKVTEIQNNFVGKFENLAEPHRRFVYEGNLHVISPNGKESPRIIYLFNDVLVGTKPTTSGLVKRKDHLKVKESIRMNLVTIRTKQTIQQQQQQQQQQQTKPTDSPLSNSQDKSTTPTTTTTTTPTTTTSTPTNNFVTAKPTVSTSAKPPASGATPPYNKPAPPKPPPRSASNTGVVIPGGSQPPSPSGASNFKPANHNSSAQTQQYLRQSAPPSTTSSSHPPLTSSDPGQRNRTSTNSPAGIAPLPKPRTITTSNNTPPLSSTTPTNNNNTNNSQQQTVTPPPPQSTSDSTPSTSTSSTSTNDMIIELCDSFGTCILKILCNSVKEKDCWVNEFKKVKEDLENRKIVNEEAMKRSQERAGIAKAALSQQYATLRIKGRLYGQSDIKSALEDGSDSPAGSSSPSTGSSSPNGVGAATTGDRDFSILRRQTMRRSQVGAGADSPLSQSPSSTPTSIGSVSPKNSKEDLTDNSGDDNSTKSKSRWFASLRSKKKKPSSSTLIQDAFSQPLDPLSLSTNGNGNNKSADDHEEHHNNTTVIVKEDENNNINTNNQPTTTTVVVKEK
ncbi:pleckstrin domain-containing protein [Cavenderia fasciculata]|uniref:Pleckstrin domain-containing protein n=1 Tax=Cavenderia fasciculata TaxID=261658 RepID=F4PLG7_CACFS|nr:pleckstrin domain-containing protein [Cavenderia fasciculata]EGG23389.1 pleckstrin domain-containing protein [Cavenderia fasciculata]|eukprot:XP_004361240.1 pleckstrin domain-containing protein [Cavenderia fasciculata]